MDLIPKIIHQTWKTNEIPEKWKELQKTWKLPNYKYILWTDQDNRNLIKNKFPWFLNQYDNYEYPIQRADVIRPFILYDQGGIYVDLDLEYLNDFWEELDQDKINIPESPYFYNEKVQNIFIASRKGHPGLLEIVELFKKMKDYKNTSSDKTVLMTTGPNIYDQFIINNKNVKILNKKKWNPPVKRNIYTLKLKNLLNNKKEIIYDNFDDNENLFIRHHNYSSWSPPTFIGNLNYLHLLIISPFILTLIYFMILFFYKFIIGR